MAMGDDLLAIIKEAEQIRREDDARPLVDCPLCGNVLDVNARGEKNCDVGHFTTAQTATA